MMLTALMEFLVPYLGVFWAEALILVGTIVVMSLCIMVFVAFVTYAERKVLGAMQRRQGPMTVGPFGLLQPIADGMKLFSKETIIPAQAHRVVFLFAPMLTFTLALVAWAVIPFDLGM